MILGKDLILALNGTPMAAAKSCGLNIQQDFIDVCSPTEARVKRKVPTTYDWSMDSDCLIATTAYAEQIIDMVTDGTELLVQFYDVQLGIYRTGYAYVSSCKITASTGSLSKMNISLVGSGALNKLRWGDIDKVLYGGASVDSTDQDECGFEYSQAGLNGLYIAIKQNNQYIRWDDGRSGDEFSNTVDDDGYYREAHFKGGQQEYYIVTGTISSNVITATMVCKMVIPLIEQFPNTWFVIRASAWCVDYEETIHGEGNEIVYVKEIKISRAES